MGARFLLRLSLALFLTVSSLTGAQVPVRYPEGRIHGFLTLRDLEDNLLASGTLIQNATGGRVTSELEFHFKDGSLHRETAVFSQRRVFQLLTYHLVQKGPAFKSAVEMNVNTSNGQVTVRYMEDDGKEKTASENMKLPADLANGLVSTLL